MDNLKRLRELTEGLNFKDMGIEENGKASKVPTKDPSIFGIVKGVLKSQGEARVAVVDFPAGSEMDAHFHDQKEIFVVISGEMILTLENGSVTLEKGDTYYVIEHSAHSAKWPVDTRMIAITIPDAEDYLR